MQRIRRSIVENRFPEFVKNFMNNLYKAEPVPKWVVDALAAVNIKLELHDNKDGETSRSSSISEGPPPKKKTSVCSIS